MKTPREKYLNNPEYAHLVKSILACLHLAQYTPSEVREAAVLACIMYEEQRIRPPITIPSDMQEHLDKLYEWTNKREPE